VTRNDDDEGDDMSVQHGFDQVMAAAAFVRDRIGAPREGAAASVGVVLGSGLGRVGDVLVENGGRAIDFGAIPHFPVSSVEGHKGRLLYATHEGAPVLVMQGRVHRYEGYEASAVVFPVRVLHALGVRTVLLTNAAGGLGDGMTPGDLMVIEDHLNLTGGSPLSGANDARFGPRFPDMSDTYTHALRLIVDEVAKKVGVKVTKGVYAGLLGPSYETPAEIRMLKTLGAHAVGMSTVYEAIAASHMGARVVGISCITNLAAGISATKLNHAEVKETAERVEEAFSRLVLALIPRLAAA
jgi:purine-nucleoside phosphorylase